MSWTLLEYNKSFSRINFDCGINALNNYLKKQLSQDIKKKITQSICAIDKSSQSRDIIGFYTLSAGQVEFDAFPEKLRNKVGRYPVPIARIGRLAVDKSFQGKGLGEEMLMHAISRIRQLQNSIGIRAAIVDCKNYSSERFFVKYGFEPISGKSKQHKTLFFVL